MNGKTKGWLIFAAGVALLTLIACFNWEWIWSTMHARIFGGEVVYEPLSGKILPGIGICIGVLALCFGMDKALSQD